MNQRLTLFALALALALALPAMAATNPHYDAKATAGGLQTVCDGISIDANALLTASCNAVRENSDGKKEVASVGAEVGLSSRIAEECMHDLTIRVTATAVYVEATCRTVVDQGGGNLETVVEDGSEDINDWIEWDAADSDFRWKLENASS